MINFEIGKLYKTRGKGDVEYISDKDWDLYDVIEEV